MLFDIIKARLLISAHDCLCNMILVTTKWELSKVITTVDITTEVFWEAFGLYDFELEVERFSKQLLWVVDTCHVLIAVALASHNTHLKLTYWLADSVICDRSDFSFQFKVNQTI